MQLVPPDDQILNQSKLCHLVVKDAIWWSNLQLMQAVPYGGQICNKCKWHHLVVKFSTNASGAMLLPNLVQVTESIFGSIGNVYKKDPECIFFAIDILCVEFIRY